MKEKKNGWEKRTLGPHQTPDVERKFTSTRHSCTVRHTYSVAYTNTFAQQSKLGQKTVGNDQICKELQNSHSSRVNKTFQSERGLNAFSPSFVLNTRIPDVQTKELFRNLVTKKGDSSFVKRNFSLRFKIEKKKNDSDTGECHSSHPSLLNK